MKMKYILIFVTCFLLCGCEPKAISPPEPVVIVEVREHKEVNNYMYFEGTVVKFPDGQLRFRQGKWGKVGDEFMASKTKDSWR